MRRAAALLVLVPVLLWASTTSVPQGPPEVILRWVSVLFALVGFTTFTANLVLVARLGSLERLFGGLDRLYFFHRALSVVTVSLLTIHGVLIGLSLWQASSLLGMRTKVVWGVVALVALLSGVGASFFVRMSHEAFVWLQRGLGVVFGAGAIHALVFTGSITIGPAIRWYLVAIAFVGGAAFLYRSVAAAITLPWVRYRVDAVRRLDPQTAEIRLAPLGEPMSYRAGQFAFLSIVGGHVSREPHPYSIVSAPDEPKLRFLVKALGDYTTKLQELEPGCEARVEGPYGGFWDEGASSPRQVWIAGGVGVAPFVAMARSLDIGRQDVDLYYCTEGPEQAHLIDELFGVADTNPKLRVIPVRRASLGRIDAEDIEGASRDIADKEIFICGPPRMMRNLADQFVALGAKRSRIHFEDFSFL